LVRALDHLQRLAQVVPGHAQEHRVSRLSLRHSRQALSGKDAHFVRYAGGALPYEFKKKGVSRFDLRDPYYIAAALTWPRYLTTLFANRDEQWSTKGAVERFLRSCNQCTPFAAVHEAAPGKFCCKSLFALVIKISFGCTRDFRVKIWGGDLIA
jgi:hypothetical protein